MKTSRGRELLTDNQRTELMQIPTDEWILGTYYTFSERDLAIILKRRREDNRLGFAVQLAVLRFRVGLIRILKAFHIALSSTSLNKSMSQQQPFILMGKGKIRYGIT
ncbi:hypothetical protein KSI01_28770 [Kurthia sibirica]|nr:hypothetical protein KSI01_28770 [Kurthia sibirica]